MTATTKSWTSIADSALDPDSPIDTALMTALRDDLIHLREWIGASYTAGAVQDHNHDGSNSAAIEIGPNWLRNGNFENGLSGWVDTVYTGGTIAVGTSHETEGTSGLVITSTVAANGGGNVLSNGYIGVVAGQARQFSMTIKASGATVPVKAEVVWYSDALAQISASAIISTTSASPTTDRLVVRRITAPATAKYCRVRLELPAAGSAAGTIYFDGVTVSLPAMLGGEQVFTASGTFSAVWGDVEVDVSGGGGGSSLNGTIRPGGYGGRACGPVTTSGDVTVTVGAGGSGVIADPAAGTAGGTSSFGSLISATGGGAATASPSDGVGTGGAWNTPSGSNGTVRNEYLYLSPGGIFQNNRRTGSANAFTLPAASTGSDGGFGGVVIVKW